MRAIKPLAHAPLSPLEIERLEVESIEAIRVHAPDADRARLVLRMTWELRKARGTLDHQEMSQREIDDEIAMLRGQS